MDEALVYTYRPDAIFYGGIQSQFHVDGKTVASINKAGYSAFHLAHTCSSRIGRAWITPGTPFIFHLSCLPGKTRYYRLTFAFDSLAMQNSMATAAHRWAISNVPESQALQEIQLTRYQASFDLDSARKVGTK